MKRLLLLTATILSSYLASAQATRLDTLIREGVDLNDRGYFEEAILKYDSAISLDSKSYLANYEKAYTYMQMKRYSDVVNMCQSMRDNLKGNAKLPEVYVMQGNALDMLKKRKESVKTYNEGIKAYPDASLLYYNKAITLFALDEGEEAVTATKWAVIKNPQHASSHNLLASVYRKSNRVLSLMAAVSFLALEPEGQRAADNLKRVKALLADNAKKTGDNAYSIDLDASLLLNNSKKKEDNFATTEMIMTLGSALNVDEKYKEETLTDRFGRNLKTVVSSLKEGQKEGKGFGWDFYVPFLIALEKDGQVEVLSHIIFVSADDVQNNTWLSANKDKVTAFYKWLNAYKWPSPKP